MVETTSNLYLKAFRERRMNMQVFVLTLWVNQKNLPAMFIDFLMALNWLFIIYFELKMFIMINYGNIWNNIDTNINLYHQTGIDLNATNHTLTSNLNKCVNRVASLFFIRLSLLGCLFNMLSILLCDCCNIMFTNKWQLQQTIELVVIYFMFMFTTLSTNIIEKESYYSQITEPLESFVDILIIFALIGFFFDVLIVLLCDKGGILHHKNKQLQQIIELSIIYLMVSFVQQENINAKRSYYETIGTTFQLFIYNSRLLGWILVFVFSGRLVTILLKINTHINCSYIISCAWNLTSCAICVYHLRKQQYFGYIQM